MGKVFKGEISMAIRMLRRNRGRSLLTMLGIVIGVASVVTIAAIGQGVTNQVTSEAQRLGHNLITIRPGQPVNHTSNEWWGGLTGLPAMSNGTLNIADTTVVSKTSDVQDVVPISLVVGGATIDENKRHVDLPVIGTSSAFMSLTGQTIAYGSFLSGDASDDNKVVIGADVANNLFAEKVPLGQTIHILGATFIVVGILEPSPATPLSGEVDYNNAVIVSEAAAQTITNNNAHITEILIRATSAAQTDAVADRLRGALLAAHGGQEDFTVLQQSQAIAATNAIVNLVTALAAGVAAIALLVGGVGIMNVMLVSITERMHEVGIRKAVGATNRQILHQFVIEAAVLSVGGAILGVVVAVLLTITLQLVTDLAPVITWQAVVLSCLASIAVGVIFGTFPALKASRRDPISALRNI